MNDPDLIEFLLFVALGFGIGSLHFTALWWSVRHHASPASPGGAVWLHGARLLVTAAAFCAVAVTTRSALPLLGTLAGFMAARPLIRLVVVRPA
jgi:F1F0 ATPase subunit 2